MPLNHIKRQVLRSLIGRRLSSNPMVRLETNEIPPQMSQFWQEHLRTKLEMQFRNELTKYLAEPGLLLLSDENAELDSLLAKLDETLKERLNK